MKSKEISKKISETDSQRLLIQFENNYSRQPCAYQRACELKLLGPLLKAYFDLRNETKRNENLQFAKWKYANDLQNRNCKLQIFILKIISIFRGSYGLVCATFYAATKTHGKFSITKGN